MQSEPLPKFQMPERVRRQTLADGQRGAAELNDPAVPLDLPRFLYEIDVKKYPKVISEIRRSAPAELEKMRNDQQIVQENGKLRIGYTARQMAEEYPAFYANWKLAFGETLIPTEPWLKTPWAMAKYRRDMEQTREAFANDPGAGKAFAREFATDEHKNFDVETRAHLKKNSELFLNSARQLGSKIPPERLDAVRAACTTGSPTEKIDAMLDKSPGIAFGDFHDDASLPKFLVDNMAYLAQKGVTHLFLEGLDDADTNDHQDLADANRDLKVDPERVLPAAFHRRLEKLDEKWGRKPGMADIADAAHRNGIRIVAIDERASKLETVGGERVSTMNAVAASKINHAGEQGGKGIVLAGRYHVAPGLAAGREELLSLPYLTGYVPVNIAADGSPSVPANETVIPPSQLPAIELPKVEPLPPEWAEAAKLSTTGAAEPTPPQPESGIEQVKSGIEQVKHHEEPGLPPPVESHEDQVLPPSLKPQEDLVPPPPLKPHEDPVLPPPLKIRRSLTAEDRERVKSLPPATAAIGPTQDQVENLVRQQDSVPSTAATTTQPAQDAPDKQHSPDKREQQLLAEKTAKVQGAQRDKTIT